MVPGLLHEGPDVGKISAHSCTAGKSGVAGLAPQGEGAGDGGSGHWLENGQLPLEVSQRSQDQVLILQKSSPSAAVHKTCLSSVAQDLGSLRTGVPKRERAPESPGGFVKACWAPPSDCPTG